MLVGLYKLNVVNFEDQNELLNRIDKCLEEFNMDYNNSIYWARGYQGLWVELNKVRTQKI